MSHAGAISGVWVSGLSTPWTVILTLLVLGSLIHACRLHAFLWHPQAVCGLVWGADNDWQLFLYSGEQQQATLLGQAFIRPYLVILYFNSRERRRRTIILLPDMLDPDCYRRLRVRLMMELGE